MYIHPRISHKKLIATLVIALVVGLVSYDQFVKPVGAADELVSEQTQSALIDKDLLAVLAKIEKINLDPTLFNNNKAFQSLEDFSVQLTPMSVGRVNPFAPLSSGVAATPRR